ncbi:MAG: M48 family metallopeptidase [Gammaproteobacteria bacterium]
MITISVDGIMIEVQRKKMKHMTMRVCPPNGTVKISAPLRSSEMSIRHFALSHIEWIQKHQVAYQGSHPDQAYTYITGERHFLQGREYILRVHEGVKKPDVNISDDTYIDMFVPAAASQEYREKVLNQFYRQLLRSQLDTLIPLWESKTGLSAVHYQLRLMKSRWGSCHPRKRKICLNLSLIKYPTVCLEYVIVHELVHFLEASHNARFKSLMDKFMPEWRSYKALFNKVS